MPVPKPKSLILDRRIAVDLERVWQIGTLCRSHRVRCWQADDAKDAKLKPLGIGRHVSILRNGFPVTLWLAEQARLLESFDEMEYMIGFSG